MKKQSSKKNLNQLEDRIRLLEEKTTINDILLFIYKILKYLFIVAIFLLSAWVIIESLLIAKEQDPEAFAYLVVLLAIMFGVAFIGGIMGHE